MSYCNIEKAKEMASKMWAFQESCGDYDDVCNVLDKCVDYENVAYWKNSEFGSHIICSNCGSVSLLRSKFCKDCGFRMLNVNGWKQ